MLVIKLELWPHGREDKKEELGRMRLWNNLQGNQTEGCYDFEITEERSAFAEGVDYSGGIEKYHRGQPAWRLVFEALKLWKEKDYDHG